jgi:hypothetical protein
MHGSKSTKAQGQAAADERRSHQRKTALLAASIDTGTGNHSCVILNVSRGGAMLQLKAPFDARQRVTLVIDRFGRLSAEVVWQDKDKCKIGLRFTDTPDRVAAIFGETVGT